MKRIWLDCEIIFFPPSCTHLIHAPLSTGHFIPASPYGYPIFFFLPLPLPPFFFPLLLSLSFTLTLYLILIG